jgi:hypothetical protein
MDHHRPRCCHACQSRTVRQHCKSRYCRVVFCLKCMATSWIAFGKVWHRGGVERV